MKKNKVIYMTMSLVLIFLIFLITLLAVCFISKCVQLKGAGLYKKDILRGGSITGSDWNKDTLSESLEYLKDNFDASQPNVPWDKIVEELERKANKALEPIERCEQLIRELKREKEALEVSDAQCKREKAELEQQLEAAKELENRLELDLLEAEVKLKQLNELNKELRRENGELNKQLQEAKREIEVLRQELAVANQKVRDLEAELSRLGTELAAEGRLQQQRIEELQTQIDGLQLQNENYRGFKKVCDIGVNSYVALDRKISALKEMLLGETRGGYSILTKQGGRVQADNLRRVIAGNQSLSNPERHALFTRLNNIG